MNSFILNIKLNFSDFKIFVSVLRHLIRIKYLTKKKYSSQLLQFTPSLSEEHIFMKSYLNIYQNENIWKIWIERIEIYWMIYYGSYTFTEFKNKVKIQNISIYVHVFAPNLNIMHFLKWKLFVHMSVKKKKKCKFYRYVLYAFTFIETFYDSSRTNNSCDIMYHILVKYRLPKYSRGKPS